MDHSGANTFTKGIWKSVYMTTVASAAIAHVVPHVFYNGSYPTEPLTDSTHAGFTVSVAVHLWAAAATTGTVGIAGEWGTKASKPVSLVAGDNKVTLEIEAATPKLWWPSGMGSQNLYNLTGAADRLQAPFLTGLRSSHRWIPRCPSHVWQRERLAPNRL